MNIVGARAALLAVCLCAGMPGLAAQATAPAAADSARNPLSGDPKAITQGAVLFRQECTFCHGVAAHGGMRAPDLTTGSWSHGGSDAELAAHDQAAVCPAWRCRPNNLTDNEIGRSSSYLRTLEQPAASTNGDRASRRNAVLRHRPLCDVSHRQRTRRTAGTGTVNGGARPDPAPTWSSRSASRGGS